MNDQSTFDQIRKPLISSGLGFTYRYMLDKDINQAIMYAGIVGLSHVVADKTIDTLVPNFDNQALDSFKNMTLVGSICGGLNAGLQLMILKDSLIMENAIIGAGCSASSILLEPTFKSII